MEPPRAVHRSLPLSKGRKNLSIISLSRDIKNMTKKIGSILLGAAMLLPIAASADVNLQEFEFTVNDRFSDEIRAGEDVDVGFSFDVDDGDEVEFARIRFINSNGDIVESACRGIGRISDANDREVEVNVDTKSDLTEGVLDVQVALFGKPGVEQANNCNLADLLDDREYSNRLFVQEGTGDSNEDNDDDNSAGSGSNDDGNNSAGSTNSAIEALKAQIAALVAQLAGLTGVVAGMAPDAICAQAPADTASLQTFLVGQGLMTSAEVATGPGIYGPKTTRAHNAFKAMHKCR